MIKIEKHIPIPRARNASTDNSFDELRETIAEMKIGNSFIIPKEFLIQHSAGQMYVGHNVYNLFKRSGKKCSVRTVDKDKKIFRCWRTE